MFLSTLCVIGVVISVCIEGTTGLKTCHDCIPFIYCKRAKYLADTDKSETTQQMFRDAYCGILNQTVVEVCCSDFNVPRFDDRWIIETEHPNARLLPNSCGKIYIDRIFGGTVAALYEFPWMVLIAYGDNAKFGCAGTLIHPRYVLTAAHCVANKDIKGIRVGDYNLELETDCQGNICEQNTQDRQVEAEIIHENYDWTSFKHDIALLRLKSPVTVPLKNADTICLPITADMQRQSITNKQATVTGWGLTEHGKLFTVLRKVVIPVRSNEVCEDYYSHISGPDPKQFCAGVYKKDSCRGDSGGPLMIETIINGQVKYVQYGIVSNGPDRCGSHAPGIYTDVRKYTDWILDKLKAD